MCHSVFVRRLALAMLAAVIGLGIAPPRAVAQPAEPPVKIAQYDDDGDGKPDRAELVCACVSPRDLITVSDGGDDMVWSGDWRQGTDFANDQWVFDIGGDGRANLIVLFITTAAGSYARLYDDHDGDGAVRYRRDGSRIVVEESPFWSLELFSPSGWIMPDGTPPANIRALIDRPLTDALEFLDAATAARLMPHDGVPDMEYVLRDADQDGVPEYFLARSMTDALLRFAGGKSRLWVNTIGSRPVPPSTALLWPWLDTQPLERKKDLRLRFFDQIPVISVDWPSAQIVGFRLAGYPIGSGYWINSRKPIFDAHVNPVDHEAPHAWYDLAQDHDPFPDLNIRLFDVPSDDSTRRWQEIRYSWNVWNPGTLIWDYKLGFLDYHPITDTVAFDAFELQMVPYERLPFWVTERTWRLSTFVARETGRRMSSEGIYAWTPWEGVDPTDPNNPGRAVRRAAQAYASGIAVESPAGYFTDIERGYRGEYNFARPSNGALYYSPVDRRLHLLGAEAGVFRLDDGRRLVYGNDNGDDYLDRWVLYDGDAIQAQLFQTLSHLVLADDQGVAIRETSVPWSEFTILPPRDPAEWERFRSVLALHPTEVQAADLRAMFSRHTGRTWQVSKAQLHDFRPTADGFRFVIEAASGATIVNPDGAPSSSLSPGRYLVAWRGRLQIEPLTVQPTPPRLSLMVNQDIETGAPTLLLVSTRHANLLDTPVLTMKVSVERNGDLHDLWQREVVIRADEPLQVPVSWTPSSPGDWRVEVRLQDAEGRTVARLTQMLTVSARPDAKPTAVLRSMTTLPRLALPWVGIGGIILLLSLVFATFGQSSARSEGYDTSHT